MTVDVNFARTLLSETWWFRNSMKVSFATLPRSSRICITFGVKFPIAGIIGLGSPVILGKFADLEEAEEALRKACSGTKG